MDCGRGEGAQRCLSPFLVAKVVRVVLARRRTLPLIWCRRAFCLSRSFESVAAHENPTALARIMPMPATVSSRLESQVTTCCLYKHSSASVNCLEQRLMAGTGTKLWPAV